MAGSSESKITRFGVANLSNNWAIAYRDVGNAREKGHGSAACDPRLELGDFDSQARSPRLNQRLPGRIDCAGEIVYLRVFSRRGPANITNDDSPYRHGPRCAIARPIHVRCRSFPSGSAQTVGLCAHRLRATAVRAHPSPARQVEFRTHG